MKRFRLLILGIASLSLLIMAAQPTLAQTKVTYAGWLHNYDFMVEAANYMETEFEKRHPGTDLVMNSVAVSLA